jgi:DNA-binding GntR family transcriptional regulator
MEGLSFEPGMRTTLKDRIAAKLRDGILRSELKPGTMLKAGDIAEALGVSRGPVREAIWQLVQEGLVVHDPHHTPVVVDLSPRDAWEIYTLRGALEEMAVLLALPQIADRDLEYLEDILQQMQRLGSSDRMSEALALDLAFHGYICSLSGHSRLIDTFRSMDAAIGTVFVGVASRFRRGPEGMAGRHRPVVEALRARDPRAAAIAREHYVVRAREFLELERDREPEPR